MGFYDWEGLEADGTFTVSFSDLEGPEELGVVRTHLRCADELTSLENVRCVDCSHRQDLGLPQQHHPDWLR